MDDEKPQREPNQDSLTATVKAKTSLATKALHTKKECADYSKLCQAVTKSMA